MAESGSNTILKSTFLSLLPTTLSAATCLVLAIAFIVTNLLLISLHYGNIFLRLFGGATADQYNRYVTEPIARIFGISWISEGVFLLFWLIIGIGVFLIGQSILSLIIELNSDSRAASFNMPNAKVHRLLIDDLVRRMVWRNAVVLLFAITIVWCQPLFHFIFHTDQNLATRSINLGSVKDGALVVLCWVFILHLILVYWRLYVIVKRA